VFMLMMCSALFGVVLGMRFRVLILPPVIFAGLTVLTVIGSMQNNLPSQIVLNVIAFAVLLQLGFVVGAYVKSVPARQSQTSLLANLKPR
jgi:hypothetical protein